MGDADIIYPFGNHSNYQRWDDPLVHLCINVYDPRIDTPIISITIPKLTFFRIFQKYPTFVNLLFLVRALNTKVQIWRWKTTSK